MTSRSVRILLVAGAFLVGLVLCFGVVLLASGRFSAPSVPQVAAIGGPFSLTDQNGRTVTDRDLKGHPFLVFFGFTHCPDVCPTSLFEISEVLKAMGTDADKVNAWFVSVDPERDTAAAMKDYLSSFDPHLKGLTGDPQALATPLPRLLFYAALCGLLLAPLLLNMAFYQVLRERFVLWHSGIVVGMLVQALISSGLVHSLVGLPLGLTVASMSISFTVAVSAAALFTADIVEPDKLSAQTRSLLRWSAMPNLVIGVACSFTIAPMRQMDAALEDAARVHGGICRIQ